MKNKKCDLFSYSLALILPTILFNLFLNELFCIEVIFIKSYGLRKNSFSLLFILSFILYFIIGIVKSLVKNGYFSSYKDLLKKFIFSPFFYVWILTILISTGVLSVSKNFVIFAHIILIITEIIFIHTNYKNKEM